MKSNIVLNFFLAFFVLESHDFLTAGNNSYENIIVYICCKYILFLYTLNNIYFDFYCQVISCSTEITIAIIITEKRQICTSEIIIKNQYYLLLQFHFHLFFRRLLPGEIFIYSCCQFAVRFLSFLYVARKIIDSYYYLKAKNEVGGEETISNYWDIQFFLLFFLVCVLSSLRLFLQSRTSTGSRNQLCFRWLILRFFSVKRDSDQLRHIRANICKMYRFNIYRRILRKIIECTNSSLYTKFFKINLSN